MSKKTASKTVTVTVTITTCDAERRQHVSHHRMPVGLDYYEMMGQFGCANGAWVAVERAVQKRWGKSASFVRDNGISVGGDPSEGTQYGQIGVPCRTGGTNLITGRMSVRVD